MVYCAAVLLTMQQTEKVTKHVKDGRAVWASVMGMLLPVSLFHRVLLSVGASDFVLAPALLTSIGRGEWRRWQKLSRDPVARWVVGFATSVVIGFFIGWMRFGHLIWWALINRGLGLFLLLGIYCLYASAAKNNVWLYLRCFVVAGSLLNLAALVAVALRYAGNRGSVFFFGGTSLRLSGLMHNPNQYGGYLAAVLAVQLTAVAFAKPMFGRSWIDAANVAFLLLGALFTISRGSWLAAMAGALVVPVVSRVASDKIFQRRHLLAPALVVLCLTAVLFIARAGGLWPAPRQGSPLHTSENTSEIYFPHNDPSFLEFLRIASDPSGVGDRMVITQTALRLYVTSLSTMAFGWGLGGFAEMAPATNLQSPVIIHNSFLWALVELGPLGFLCVAGIFQAALRKLWGSLHTAGNAHATAAALFAALVSVLIWSLSNDGMYQRQLWFLLGLASTTVTDSKLESSQ